MSIASGRQLGQGFGFDPDRQRRITATDRMADPVGLDFVDEQNLAGVDDGVDAADVMNVDTAVREDQVGGRRALFVGEMPNVTWTHHVPDGGGIRRQDRRRRELGRGPTMPEGTDR